MTIITGHYEWGRLCSQQHPVAGDILKLSIELHYNSNMPEFAESQPFVCIEPNRFLKECKDFLCSFLRARHMRAICLTIIDGVVCAIQKRFEFVPSTSTNDDTIAREPHEFALHLIIVLRDEYLNTLHVSVKDNTVENGLETSGGCKSSLKKYKVTNESDERCIICMEEFRVSGGDDANSSIFKEVCSTPCGHVFHDVCIVSWLVTSPHCPLCRYSIPLTINH